MWVGLRDKKLSVGDYVSQMIQISVFTKLENLFTEILCEPLIIGFPYVQNHNCA